MKKRIIFVLILFFVSFCVFADDGIMTVAETPTNEAKSNTFYLYLNKNGKDQVWFSEKDDPDNHITRHIFPLVTDDYPESVSTEVQLNWSLQSENASTISAINVYFIGDDSSGHNDSSETETGYMLRRVKKEGGINYNVSTSNPSSVTGISAYNNYTAINGAQKLEDRKITLEKEVVIDGSDKKIVLTLTVTAPSVDGNGNYAWMDEQYVGYIKAEIVYGS